MNERIHELFEEQPEAELGTRAREAVRTRPQVIFEAAAAISEGGRLPPAALTRACQEELGLLADLPPDAVREGIESCLLGRDVDRALEWLREVGAVALLLPELEATRDLAQEAGRRHKDVWEHTKLVVKQAVRRPAVRWAALLHDIGKVPTRTFTKNGVHFHGHAEVGARMFDKMSRRLPFDRAMRLKIRFLIRHHLRSNQYSSDWTDNAVRRFGREMDAHLTDLLDLSRADITSRRPGRRRFLLRQISELSQRVESLRELDARVPPLPKGVGTAIMEYFQVPPSRRIGELKEALEAAIERGEIEERREDEYYVRWLEASGLITKSPPKTPAD